MSIGNTSLHQSGEIPEIVKLPNGRIRVTRRFHKFTREDVDNANLGSLMGDFGDLDIAGEQISNQGYTNCRLISVEVDTRFNSVSNTDSAVLVKTYETLTAVWTKEQDDEVTSTDNGLRVLERSEVANLDGFPIVQLSSPNGSKVVLSGMGNASNYFVLLVKANSANTIYWRATNEALATHTGSFTTANTDQWEYKVIYTPISIDQLEIGYDGTNNSTFNLSEFYLVSQSSDWQNNIVESFIEFEVTVDNSSTFTDTVVFTGSNGNTATGTNVQGGGTGSISSPYDEDDVGVATITDGGKTLYLASFQDQTGAESNAQVGRVVTRWAEAGILSRTEDFVGSQDSLVIEAIGPDPSTPLGFSLASKQESNYEGLQTNRFTFLKDNVVLSVSEDKVGSQKAIVNEVFNPASEAITGIDTSGTALTGYSEANRTESDYEGIKTIRVQFLKPSILSQSEDKVGSQLAITIEAFGEVPDTPAGYSLARTDVSDFEGIKTNRYTFLKPSVLSRSIREQNNGALIIETVEAFNEIPTANTTGAVNIGEDVSNVEGIPTRRYTFAKGDGQIQVSKRPASPSLAGATEVTVVSYGTAVTPTGVLIAESETEEDGYVQYTKTALQGTITGVKHTYKDVVDVEVPGTVTLEEVSTAISDVDTVNLSGTIAIPKVIPPRRKKIAATVTVEITTNPPSTASLAYDLGEISCSVTSYSESYNSRHGPTKRSKVGIFISTYVDWQRSYSPSARLQVYEGCYIEGASSASGSVSYQSGKTHILDPDEDEDGYGDGLDTTINSQAISLTKCVASGSTAATGYAETGVLKRSSRPILTALDGTTYYEVITWSI
jgi:hypothetical protein